MDDATRSLMDAKTIALVGLDTRVDREAYRIAIFLKSKGYRVIPVPVQQPADEVLGEKAYRRVQDIPVHIDLVDVFVRSEHTDPIIDDAIAAKAGAVWLQLGIRNDAGLERARGAGLVATQDVCTAVEYQRAQGEWQEKQRLLEKLASERKRLLDEVALMAPGEWNASDTGEWNLRQQLLHIAAAEKARLGCAEQIRKGRAGIEEPPRFAPSADAASELSEQEILGRLATARAATVAFVESLSDRDFELMGDHPSLGRVAIIQLLRSIYGHDQQHISQLERARAAG